LTGDCQLPTHRSLLIKNGYVVTMNAERRIVRDGAVLIEDKKIVAVEKTDKVRGHKADTVLNAKNMLVMPGLVDTHVHLAQALLRGCADDVALVDWLKNRVWVLQGNFTREDGEISAKLCMAEMIRTGTTSFVECMIHTRYGFDGIAKAVQEAGMRAALSKIIMDSTGYADNPDIMHPGMVEESSACLKETEAMLSKWHNKGEERIHVWYGLRSLGAVSTELFREVVQRARSHRTRMTMHLGEVIDDVRYVKEKNYPNLTSFARDMGLLGPDMVFAHGVHFNEADLKALAETKSNVSHCPASNMKLASGFARVPDMLRVGVPVSLGCDGGPSNNTYDMIREMRLAALIHKPVANDPTVVSAENVLEMATIGGATALGLQDRIGSLESGKIADLILIDMKDVGLTPICNPVSNLVYAASGKCVDTVIVDGRLLMKRKRLMTLNDAEIMKRANERLDALLVRAGVTIEPKWPVS